jgi:SP family general alpha glucoside:H+ symporter-like MFS transporter
MESYDTFLIGNYVALPAFQQAFGEYVEGTGWVLATRWQTALQQAGQLGALVGIFICGPLTNRVGYRWATIIGLVLMNATIFISFFAQSLPVVLIGQLFEGIPWGFFIANAPAYSSEVVPLALRGAATAYVMMCWSLGNMISNGVTYVMNQRTDEWAYRLPFALQWMFPTPLLILVIFAPESPWWLVRKGRHDEALKSIRRLGSKSAPDPTDVLAMMIRTANIEQQETQGASYRDLLRGTDLRRTL